MPQADSSNISKCPRCRAKKIYSIRRDNARCSSCMYEWHPGKLPTHMEPEKWRDILKMFLQNLSSSTIAEKSGQNIKQILKAVGYARSAMATDVPTAFSELAENMESLRFYDFGTDKQPIFGIIFHKDYIWFSKIDDSKPAIDQLTGVKFSAFVSKNTFELTEETQHAKNEIVDFWTTQKHILIGRSGLRSEKFGLYLAEAIWRHNHRKQSCTSQIEHLLYIIGQAWYVRNKK